MHTKQRKPCCTQELRFRTHMQSHISCDAVIYAQNERNNREVATDNAPSLQGRRRHSKLNAFNLRTCEFVYKNSGTVQSHFIQRVCCV